MRYTNKRTGFTLIELMVVMAIIAFLSAMVLLVAPSVLDKDRARDAATQLQGAIQNARMRAMRDGLPRGVRLLVDMQAPTETIPAPSVINGISYSPSGGTGGANPQSLFTKSSAYQYIEVPPWLTFTNLSGTGLNPFLRFDYTLDPGTGTGAIFNQVLSRTCTIGNLTQAQHTQLKQIVTQASLPPFGPILGLPTLNFWTSIDTTKGNAFVDTTPPPKKFPFSCTIQLSIYPDAMLGAQTSWLTTIAGAGDITGASGPAGTKISGPAYFGIYQPPRPLLGEPIITMPLNTTVDLSDGLSQPSFAGLGGYTTTGALAIPGYDLLFSPSGQLMSPAGFGQVFLWIRNPTKGLAPGGGQLQLPNNYAPNPDPPNPFLSISPLQWNPANSPNLYLGSWATTLPNAGEQLLITVKANSGGTGVSQVIWPTGPNQSPILSASQTVNAQ